MPPKSLTVADSSVASEWDEILNGKPASEVAISSHQEAWWKAKCGHVWQAKVASRTKGTPCPYCTNRRVLAGFNDLATVFPEIASEWSLARNGALLPSDVLPGSNKSVFWEGACGHVWDMKVTSRTSSKQGCPYCSGKRILAGFNDLASRHPEVAADWDYQKNQPASSPDAISWSSGKPAHWKCAQCSHEWTATVSSRTSGGQGCRPCGYKRNSIAFATPSGEEESLSARNPELVSEWHPTKNGNLSPTERKPNSHDVVWWLCRCGHEWKAPIARRSSGIGCPACGSATSIAKRRAPLTGVNDVASQFPHLLSEWHPTKNGALSLEDRRTAARDLAWWICKKKHEWVAAIYNRTLADSGCPVCARAMQVSGPEKQLAEFLQSLSPLDAVLTSVRSVIRGELDIYIPAKNFAVEFNGLYWHSEKFKEKHFHQQKWLACKEKGVQLVQVWEDEWRRNPEQVKQMLAHKLGMPYGDEPKVMARKTHPVAVSKAEAEAFLGKHHVQGYANGSYYLALVGKDVPVDAYKQEDLLAVLVLKKEAGTEGKTLNIIRYATAAVVPGGFTKLLKHAERSYQPERFITFSDNCVSDGGLYRNNGFVADKELPPDYMYVVGGERKHKFSYRLKRFRNDPALKWEEGLSERELAELNGLKRVWDAGKTRWVKDCLTLPV